MPFMQLLKESEYSSHHENGYKLQNGLIKYLNSIR